MRNFYRSNKLKSFALTLINIYLFYNINNQIHKNIHGEL
jgi:hypothetical protein